MEPEFDQQESVRLASLSDVTSHYYKGLSRVLEEADSRERMIRKRADKVMFPFVVSTPTRRIMEERFGWQIECSDGGVRSRFPEFVAALVYCMSLRNLFKSGGDGQEVVALDEDLAMMTARGASYVHVCRTHATVRLQAGYAHEDVQLQRLSTSSKSSIALSALEVKGQLAAGGGERVCVCAATCRRAADVLLINHARTPVSLAQAIATARAHGADVIEGECFFQPDMLVAEEGELEAFPGRYVIDRARDELCYIPQSDPTLAFSHPYTSLMSFFLNHEYSDRSGRWLVEKGMSKQGVFSYVVRRADMEPFRAAETVSAHYYPASMSRVTRIEYPCFDARAYARGGNPMGRKNATIFTDLFDRVMEKMVACEIKDITPENVMTALRDRNNTTVIFGDVVKRPNRVLYSDEVGASIGICAMARWRRASASSGLGLLLDGVKRRYSLREASAAKLLMLAVSTKFEEWWPTDFGTANVERALVAIDDWMGDMAVTAETVDNVVTITRVIGASEYTVGAGECKPWLPGYKQSRFSSILSKARSFVRSCSDAGANVYVDVEVPVGSPNNNRDTFPSSSDSHSTGSDADFQAVTELRAEQRAVENIEHRLERVDASPELTTFQRELVDKLIKDQDALHLGREPRTIVRYEGPVRVDVVPVPALRVPVVSAIQTDYDSIMHGISEHDMEVVPYIASESTFERNIDVNMAINDSKRDIAPSRVIRRSKVRTMGTGARPRDQSGLISALFKRNAGVPPTRGHVDLDSIPNRAVDAMTNVCFVSGWEKQLASHLEHGLWQPSSVDLESYVPKLEHAKAEKLLSEFFSLTDVDFSSWLLMAKGKTKPPVDLGADAKVALPQTIMYNESSGMNAMFASMMSRVHDVIQSLLRPEIRLNSKESPADHEAWFNTLNARRASCRSVYRYEGDIFCYDRSQEDVGLTSEIAFYRKLGLNEETLRLWSRTHGVKKATSMMLGVVIYIAQQGLSGIFKTLMRNGLICIIAVVMSCDLSRESIITLDVKGDDFLLECSERVNVARSVNGFALTFNLSTKFYGVEVTYFCSRYWVFVDGYWYWVADPIRKAESICSAIVCDGARDFLPERWISLREDLRHYDNGLIVEALALAVKERMGLSFLPMGLICGLATLADSRDEFFNFYGPEERIG